MRYRRFVPICLALLFALSGCQDPQPPSPPAAKPILEGSQLRFPAGHPQLTSLPTVMAERAQPVDIEMPARVVWDEDRTQRLYPAFAGRVMRIQADVGQRISAGQVLAELASPEFGVAQAESARAQADLGQARRQHERLRDLHGLGVAPRKELEQAETEVLRAQAELERAQARTQLYGSSGGVNQRLALVAGVTGVIIERNVNPGQELRPDQFGPGSPALYVLSDPTRLWLLIDVREGELAALPIGRQIGFVAHAYPQRRFTATVHASSDAIDPVSRTIKVRARIDNADRALKVEMLGKVRLSQSLGEGVFIPAASVFLQEGNHWAYVVPAPGVFEPRKVSIGHRGSSRVLISAGLAEGERVVSENVLLLARMYRNAQETQQQGHATTRQDDPR